MQVASTKTLARIVAVQVTIREQAHQPPDRGGIYWQVNSRATISGHGCAPPPGDLYECIYVYSPVIKRGSVKSSMILEWGIFYFVEMVRPHLPTTCWAMTCHLTCCRFMKNYSLLASEPCFSSCSLLERANPVFVTQGSDHQLLASD